MTKKTHETIPETITILVKLDEKTFCTFALFDLLCIRRKWIRPLIFLLIFSAFGTIALLSGREESGLIAGVLFTVGISLPLIYFGSFISQAVSQIRRRRLQSSLGVYTVTLAAEGVSVENNLKKEKTLHVSWSDIHRAYRVKGCIYLYVTESKAFLLPSGQADASDEAVWAYLTGHGVTG